MLVLAVGFSYVCGCTLKKLGCILLPVFYALLPGRFLRFEAELALPPLLLKGEGTGPPGGIRAWPTLVGAP